MATKPAPLPRAAVTAREISLGGVLTALSIVIPFVFRGTIFQVYIPPFSATLASHVPTMLSMLVSPLAAGLVGVGSFVAFFVTTGPVIGLRAGTHAVWGVLGAVWIRRGVPYWKVLLWVLPMHALGEAAVVLVFGLPLVTVAWFTLGFAVHHVVDAMLSMAIARAAGARVAA